GLRALPVARGDQSDRLPAARLREPDFSRSRALLFGLVRLHHRYPWWDAGRTDRARGRHGIPHLRSAIHREWPSRPSGLRKFPLCWYLYGRRAHPRAATGWFGRAGLGDSLWPMGRAGPGSRAIGGPTRILAWIGMLATLAWLVWMCLRTTKSSG